MNYQLTGITKRSKCIYYHICYIYADGRTKYLEMRRERTDKDNLYLKCCRRSKCNATISFGTEKASGTRMEGTNNSSESINRSLKKFTTCGAKSLNTVFRSIYNFKVDQNKRMLCATRKKKRNAKTIEKFNRIKEILSEFDTFTPDEQITSLCATLERLGSL